MKRFVSLLLFLLLIFNSVSFGAWDDTAPAGSSNASDIDTNITANNAALEGMLDEVRGWKNLKVVRDSVTQVTVTADILYLQSSSNLAVQFSSVSEAIAITTSGASGLDTGVEAEAWYYIWIIAKSSDGTINGLLSASSSSPTMPSGYDQKTLVSAVRNNSSSDFVDFIQYGDVYTYSQGQAAFSGAPAAWQSFSTANYVPSALSNRAFGTMAQNTSGSIAMTNNSSVAFNYSSVQANRVCQAASTSVSNSHHWDYTILTADTLYAANNGYGGTVYIDGFYINKL